MAALQIPRLAVAQSGLKHMDRISIPATPNENTINTLHLFIAGQNENCCTSMPASRNLYLYVIKTPHINHRDA
jgi:hypothetical protein